MSDADYLRRQAERCRRLARAVSDDAVSEELEKLAGEFDQRAQKLEDAERKP